MTRTRISLEKCFNVLRFRPRRQPVHSQDRALTLADLPPGAQAEIASFLHGLSVERQAHLCAYGLTPGSRVQVKQHQPVTVVQVDHTELAMENALARQVRIRQQDYLSPTQSR